MVVDFAGASDPAPLDSTATFGEILHWLRKSLLRMTQVEMGAALSDEDHTYSGPHISRLESGERRPPTDRYFYDKLREILGVYAWYVDSLREAPDAPARISAPASLPGEERRLELQHRGVQVVLSVSADKDVFEPEQLELLFTLTKTNLEGSLDDTVALLQRRRGRSTALRDASKTLKALDAKKSKRALDKADLIKILEDLKEKIRSDGKA